MIQYCYIAPHIFPIFPRLMGKSIASIDFHTVFLDSAPECPDADFTLLIEVYENGACISSEEQVLKMRDGKISPRIFNRTFQGTDHCGYAVFSLKTEKPYFRRLKPEFGYGMLLRHDGGFTTVVPQAKYAVPAVIDNMRETGMFCVVHQAVYVDSGRDTGNSIFFINPYDGKILTKIKTASGKSGRKRLEPNSAVIMPLNEFVEDGQPECLMMTGNNRMVAWDLRHHLKDPTNIYNVDHMEYFRANPTVERRSFPKAVKRHVRRFLRDVGVWY